MKTKLDTICAAKDFCLLPVFPYHWFNRLGFSTCPNTPRQVLFLSQVTSRFSNTSLEPKLDLETLISLLLTFANDLGDFLQIANWPFLKSVFVLHWWASVLLKIKYFQSSTSSAWCFNSLLGNLFQVLRQCKVCVSKCFSFSAFYEKLMIAVNPDVKKWKLRNKTVIQCLI